MMSLYKSSFSSDRLEAKLKEEFKHIHVPCQKRLLPIRPTPLDLLEYILQSLMLNCSVNESHL